MNIMLTNICNMNCEFCFAKIDAPDEMSVENAVLLHSLVKEWGLLSVGLLGGEPTLHSQFEEVINIFSSLEIPMTLFTNGIVSEDVSKFVRDTKEINIIVVNLVSLEDSVHEFVEMNNGNTMTVGTTVDAQFDGRDTLDFINRHDIKNVRLGLANPVCGTDGTPLNSYLSIGDMDAVAASISCFSQECLAKGVELIIDCCVPLCMFTDEQLGGLYRHTQTINSVCSPTVDVGTDLKVWRCFATSNYHNDKYIHEFESFLDVFTHLDKQFIDYQILGGWGMCDNCPQHELRRCQGGCIGHSIKRKER